MSENGPELFMGDIDPIIGHPKIEVKTVANRIKDQVERIQQEARDQALEAKGNKLIN